VEAEDNTHISPEEKIQLNFKDEGDRNAVRQYLKFAYTKLHKIDEQIKIGGSERERQLQSHIFGKYRALKKSEMGNIEILEALFQDFVVKGKEENPEYTDIAKAFVLFFFDDCTIFEKTEEEKQSALFL
jgi:hypothetical protein